MRREKRRQQSLLKKQRFEEELQNRIKDTPISNNCYIYPTKKIRTIKICLHCNSPYIYKLTFSFGQHKSTIKKCTACGSNLIPTALASGYRSYLEKNGYIICNPELLLKDTKDQDLPQKMLIDVKDFVVKTSSLKCNNKNHTIDNITAVVKIVNKQGKIIEQKVPGGYCRNCNVFFIMEDSYKKLKNAGIILCRITDEKTYRSYLTSSTNGWKFAKESILMQYGYSVSQTHGLTEKQRHNILALIIEHKILSKSNIISYLDQFIQFRKNRPQYELSIQKWSIDKQFVNDYKIGSYQQFYINSITRK